MKKLDDATIVWVEQHDNLIRWLMSADKQMVFGKIVINYNHGKITSYDICPRERMGV